MRLLSVPPAVLFLCFASTATPAADPLAGRWDLTIQTGNSSYPSWIEIDGQSVKTVGRVASVHSGENVQRSGSQITFATTESLGKEIKVDWTLYPVGDKLTGTQKRADGTMGQVIGVHAPALDHPAPAKWSKPESLFNGKNLNGWEPMTTGEPGKSAASHWKAGNGELLNTAPGTNIKTQRKFQDFKLHLEFNCPQDGNSGVYLRGRYEVQVEYEPADANDKMHGMGSIYGFLAPAAELPHKPGQWETYDITLVGRKVTVVRDGTTTIDNQEIPGITGGAIDSNEGAPGPLYIQGDHTGGMKYRNITISVPQ